MPKRNVEADLDKLNQLKGAPREEATAALAKALRDPVNVVVARAARLAGELALCDLIPALTAAFDRLFRHPNQSDPQCWGKNALSKALKDLGHDQAATFLKGVGHIQLEPVWGGVEDTAATLRGTCALALIQCQDIGREETLRHLVDALAETAVPVRAEAARGLEQMGGLEAILLLRLKARAGDEDARVTGQAFESLLSVEGDEAVTFVASFLDRPNEEVHDEAALALGASRLPSAVALLAERWRKSPREAFLRALSLSRQQSAFDFLLDVIRNGRERDALAVLGTLEIHRHSSEICRQIAVALSDRPAEALHTYFSQHFARPASDGESNPSRDP